MSKPTVDTRIWEILRKYEDKLPFEDRSDIACLIDDLFEENKKSTPELDRIMALEAKLDRQSLLVADALSDVNNQAVQIETLTGDTNKTHVLTVAVGRIVDGHTGQIAELTEQLKQLRGKYEKLESRKTIIEELLVQQAYAVVRELTTNRVVTGDLQCE